MESIRVLQDTFELLYALSFPFGEYLDSHLCKLDKNLFENLFLTEEKNPENFKYKKSVGDLDIYYQTKILNKYWNDLKQLFPHESHFYEYSNRSLINDIKEIRNNIMHTDHSDYSYSEFYNDRQKIKQAAILFGTPIEKLLINLHNTEKQKLLNIIKSEVIHPALNTPELEENIKASIRDTEKRLELKTIARSLTI